MARQTNEEIRIDTAALAERLRQWRIEQGLPPEPKRVKPFVSIPLSLILLERLQPFVQIAVKYTALLAGGTVHRIDTAAFDKYREYAEILQGSCGTWCKWSSTGFLGMLKTMEKVNTTAEDDFHLSDILRLAHFEIEMMRHDTRGDMWEIIDDKVRNNSVTIGAEIERLKNDPAAFQAEYDAALEQLKQLGEDFAIE